MKHVKLILTIIAFLTINDCIIAQKFYVKSGSGVNLRSGKGTSHSVVTTIPANGEVKVIHKEGDWWQVEYKGQTGYVNADYLSEQKTEGSTNGASANDSESKQGNKKSTSSSASNSSMQNWAVGIRLGDPSGITVKKYTGNRAIELSAGRTRIWYGNSWYDKRFDDWYKDKKFGYEDFDYLGFNKPSVPIGLQLHYLFNKNIAKIGDANTDGLHWYYGFGGQLRFQTYTFDYRYKLNKTWFYSTETVTDFDIGADGVVGLEYRFKDVPVSLFTDVTLFMEVFDNPFLFWFQGGIGGRYNF